MGYRRGSLVVSEPESKQRIPLQELDTVILFAGQITTDALAQCVRRRVRVAALTRTGRIRFIVGGHTTGNVHLRLAQYATATTFDKNLALCRVTAAREAPQHDVRSCPVVTGQQ